MKHAHSLAGGLVVFACFASVTSGVAAARQHEPPSGEATAHDVAPEGAGEHSGEHAVEAGEHEEHGPKPINWFDFSNREQPPYAAAMLNFLILAGLYYGLGRKPVAEALKTRRAVVAKQIEEAQKMKHEAEERAKHYQAKLADLESELATTKKALAEAGKGDRDRIVKDAEEKAARMQKDALFLIDQELLQMRQDLMREAVELAVRAAEELLKQKVTPADQERLANEFLGGLAAPKAEGRTPAQGSPMKDGGAA